MDELKTEYLDLPTIRIAYTRSGAGSALILLHGNSGSKKTFRQYQSAHFADFDTVAIDSRGHGESVSCDEELSIEQMSEDVIEFCNVMGIKEAFVVGYSDGGNIALFLARKAPSLFSRIVAISPNYLVEGSTDGTLKLTQIIMKIFKFLKRLGFKMDKYIMRFDLMLNDIGLSDDDLRSINANMKIIYAENDMIKEEHILKMADLIPGCELEKIEDSNHLNIVNKPKTIEAIRRFFGK